MQWLSNGGILIDKPKELSDFELSKDTEDIYTLGCKVSYWDTDDKRSLVNTLPDGFAERLKAMEMHKYADLDERILKNKIKPTPLVNQLRMRFWLAYDRAQAHGRKMQIVDIYAGLCTPTDFFRMFFQNKFMTAYILKPPINYTTALEEALLAGIGRIRELLDLPLVDPATGKINTSLGNLILKSTIYLDMRLRGAFTQKIEHKVESRSLNMNVDASSRYYENAQKLAGGSQASLESKESKLALADLNEIDNELRKFEPDPVGVEAEVVHEVGIGKALSSGSTATEGEDS
jgi:hypothetical protein